MELRRILDGPLADCSEEHWKLCISRAAEYGEKAENEAEEARSAELDDIEDKIAETPARTLEGLLAKLRWLVRQHVRGCHPRSAHTTNGGARIEPIT